MANNPTVVDLSQSYATFIATPVSDGTYADVVETAKVDAPGEAAAATSIATHAGQLWGNVVDDFMRALWDAAFLVDGSRPITGGVTIQGAIDARGGIENQATGTVAIDDDLDVAGTLGVEGDADVVGNVTLGGNLTLDSASPTHLIGDGTGAVRQQLAKADASSATIEFFAGAPVAGSLRWQTAFDSTESLTWIRYDALGAFVDVPFVLRWTTGIIELRNTVSILAAVHLSGVATDSTIDADDWNPGGNWPAVSKIRSNPGASIATGGLDAAGVSSGQLVLLVNISSTNTITLEHEEATSAAANRFACPGQVDFAVGPGASVFLTYEPNSRWRVVST